MGRKLTSGDLARIYDAYAAAMFRHGMALLRDEAAVRDLIQDVFVKLAGGRMALEQAGAERTYLLRMVHHAAVDRMRREAVRRDHVEQASGQGELFATTPDPDASAFRASLEAAMSELPAEQREVVALKLAEGLTFQEIAEISGISINTAASRYRYALDKLRGLLRPVYEEL
ncbi:MAG: sigma-70 family RNA polymerase sigma factor [Luteolibacter sp.]